MILENNIPEEEMDEQTSPISFFSEDIAFKPNGSVSCLNSPPI